MSPGQFQAEFNLSRGRGCAVQQTRSRDDRCAVDVAAGISSRGDEFVKGKRLINRQRKRGWQRQKVKKSRMQLERRRKVALMEEDRFSLPGRANRNGLH